MSSKAFRYFLSACLVPISIGIMPVQAQSLDLK